MFKCFFRQVKLDLSLRNDYRGIFIRSAHSDYFRIGVLISVDVLDVVLLVLEDRSLLVTLYLDTHIGRLVAGAWNLTLVGRDHLEWLKQNEYKIGFLPCFL